MKNFNHHHPITLILQPFSTGQTGFIRNVVPGIILCIIVVFIYPGSLQFLLKQPIKKRVYHEQRERINPRI